VVSRRRVVVLGGAGAMGRIIVRDLVAAGDLDAVVVDLDPSAAEGLGAELVKIDAGDAASLAGALRGATSVIASLPYRLNLLAMDAALEAGVHYLDLGGLFHVTRQQLARAQAFRDAGLMAILGMGSAPGIVNVRAAGAAAGMARVDVVHILVGARDSPRWRVEPRWSFGYSPDTLLDELVLPTAVYRDGAYHMVPALDPAERRRERFPAPIGELDLDTTLHSEVATLPGFFADRGVREVTFRQSLEPDFMARLALVIELGLADREPLAGLGIAPRDVLRRLLMAQPPPEPDGPLVRDEVLRVRVIGDGREAVLDCHAGPDAGGGVGPDIDTGAPPSIAAQLLGTDIAIRPGVFAAEEVVPWPALRRELERRGMVVREA
jgi:saccharopine dehydrogenase-like NADP-dependent oxidoreductase